MNTINAFLQNSPEIAGKGSRFASIYKAVSQDYATVLVFRAYDANDAIVLKIGFVGETSTELDADDVTSGTEILAAGPVYRAVLTPSAANASTAMLDLGEGAYPRYQMAFSDPNDYEEGAFALEVRIFAEEPSLNFEAQSDLAELSKQQPFFTYNTAIVR